MARIRSTSPAPWKERSRPRSVAVARNTSFTRSGRPMNYRFTDRKEAMQPETWGAAMLVPLDSM